MQGKESSLVPHPQMRENMNILQENKAEEAGPLNKASEGDLLGSEGECKPTEC